METLDQLTARHAREQKAFDKQKQDQWLVLLESYEGKIPSQEYDKWQKQYGQPAQAEIINKRVDDVRRHPEYRENPDLGPPLPRLGGPMTPNPTHNRPEPDLDPDKPTKKPGREQKLNEPGPPTDNAQKTLAQSKFYRPEWLNPDRLKGAKTDLPKDKSKDKDKDPER